MSNARCMARAATNARPAAKVEAPTPPEAPTTQITSPVPFRGAPRSAIALASHPAPSGNVTTAAPNDIDH